MAGQATARTWSGAQVTHLIATTATQLEKIRHRLRIYPSVEERKLLISMERYLVDILDRLRAIQQDAEQREVRERLEQSGVICP
jgi:hypothetical protein